MARIRTIKPEFFTSEDIVSMTPLARLLYIALWCEADKEGRMAWKPNTFKMRYLPGDDCSIEKLCGELISCGVVVLYGSGLAFIPGFSKHQHVNPRESASTLPEPDGYEPAPIKHITSDLRQQIIERDGSKCVRCGSDDHIQIDHILPQSSGGPHIFENLRVLCRTCNAGRPVQGQSLADDLEKDGYTVEMLRVKFGIDASNLDLHAQVGREGKGREGKGKEHALTRFAEFWETWPSSERKQDKGKCADKWKSQGLKEIADLILADIATKKLTQKWQGGFIEAPEVYLNNRRWEDGVIPESPQSISTMTVPSRQGVDPALAKAIADSLAGTKPPPGYFDRLKKPKQEGAAA